MKAYPTSELLELSLGFEKNAQAIYADWARKFSGLPDVAAFWQEYSTDEAIHARLLEKLHDILSPDELVGLIESELVGDTRRMLAFLQKENAIQDLQQAYEYANMLEHSELNPLIELLLGHFEPDEKARNDLHGRLAEHINKLIYNFPERYSSPELRREIKV